MVMICSNVFFSLCYRSLEDFSKGPQNIRAAPLTYAPIWPRIGLSRAQGANQLYWTFNLNKSQEDRVDIFMERMLRAAQLKVDVYEEVEADKTAMGQAMGVVVLSSMAAGIGSIAKGGLGGGILFGTIAALIGWYVWAYITYLIGTKVLPEPQTKADHGELLRTVGFSSAPGLIRIFGIIPGLTKIVFLIASVWMLIAMVIAVRQALDYESTYRAVGVCLIGWVIQTLILVLLLSTLGGLAG